MVQTGYRGSFTGEEVKKCVAKLENRKAAGADETVNYFMVYGEEGMVTMMVMLYNLDMEKRVRA